MSELTDFVSGLDLHTKEWDSQLKDFLKKQSVSNPILTNVYFPLMKSITKEGTDTKDNLFLHYIDSILSIGSRSLQKPSEDFFITFNNLISSGDLDPNRDTFLTQKEFYDSDSEEDDILYKVKSIVFSRSNEAKEFGDPKSLVGKLIDRKGNPINPSMTAAEIKQILTEWQNASSGTDSDKGILGTDIIADALNLVNYPTIDDIKKYLATQIEYFKTGDGKSLVASDGKITKMDRLSFNELVEPIVDREYKEKRGVTPKEALDLALVKAITKKAGSGKVKTARKKKGTAIIAELTGKDNPTMKDVADYVATLEGVEQIAPVIKNLSQKQIATVFGDVLKSSYEGTLDVSAQDFFKMNLIRAALNNIH